MVGGHSGPEKAARVPTVWTSTDGAIWTRVVLETSVLEDGGALGVAIHGNVVTAVGWLDNDAAIWRAEFAR